MGEFFGKGPPQEHGGQKNEIKETPRVFIDFFFGEHETAADLEALRSKFESADIAIFEMVRSSKHTELGLNKLSHGQIDAQTFLGEVMEISQDEQESYTFFKAMTHLIYKSGKPILLVDVNEKWVEKREEKLGGDLARIYDSKEEQDLFLRGRKRGAIYEQMERTEAWAEVQNEREDVIAKNLKQDLVRRARAYSPELRKKKGPIHILVQLGAGHTGVYITLKQWERTQQNKSTRVTREFQGGTPYIYGHKDRIVRKKMFPNATEVSDIEHIRAIMGDLLFEYLKRYTTKNTEPNRLNRLVSFLTDQLAASSLKEIMKTLSDMEQERKDRMPRSSEPSSGIPALDRMNRAMEEGFFDMETIPAHIPHAKEVFFSWCKQRLRELGYDLPGSTDELNVLLKKIP